MQASEKIWFDGKLVPWDQATVHVAAHVIQYGSSVFEGIRAYSLPAGPAVFCLDAHLERLSNSCKIYRLDMPYDRDTISRAVLETVRTNRHAACYIRPVVFRGLETLAVNGQSCPTHVSIITIEMGTYLGPEALQNGVSAGVSSWQRLAPNTYPAAAKIGGQYINSQFIAMEAARHGYTEGIALDINGYVSEGSGENLFIVRKGQLFTPPLAASILEGITRACVMTLAEEKGIKVNEEQISRETLYLADEIFFCGTAAEITPVRSVDGIVVGNGGRGAITAQLAGAFFDIVEGRVPDRHGWLTPVG